uniref:Palmitoyltransferase n=1 Tax=Phallusia mammillata TaxID=59560 RepID=A0A6F9DWV8_9ASCI|nr:probable palmitoyltransferase ZDHHC24 [Phallusia mammillata]
MEERRKIILKRRPEKIIVGGIIVLVFAVYFFELLLILPKIYGPGFSSSHKIAHVVAGTWILFNALISMWKFIVVDPGSGSVVLPSILKEGWRFCYQCEANYPPRSYHCFSCDQCVLVRDHHCVIGANCVGYKTRRYFLHMNIYLWIALLYANILNMDFVFELYHTINSQSLLTMFMPMLAWMFGIAKGETFLMAMFTSLCVVSFLYATAILLFHMRNTLKGRTTPEVMKKLGQMYNLGIVNNLREAFGINWPIAWISPLIPSPLPGDGITFKEKEFVEQNEKSM